MGSFPVFNNVPFLGNITTNSSGNLVTLPDLNSEYGNPDVPTSSLYGGGSGSTGYGSTNPSSIAGSIPTFSTTVTASADPTDYTSSLGDPLSSLNLPSGLPSIPSLQAGIAGGNAVTDWLNGLLGAGSSQQPYSALGSALGNTAPVPAGGGCGLNNLTACFGGTSATLGGFTWGRIGAFALALILIAGGLYLFGNQTTQGVISTGFRKAVAV
jgi:hypothetical protein